MAASRSATGTLLTRGLVVFLLASVSAVPLLVVGNPPSHLPAGDPQYCDTSTTWPAANANPLTQVPLLLEFATTGDVTSSPFFGGGTGEATDPYVIHVPGCLEAVAWVHDIGFHLEFVDMTFWLSPPYSSFGSVPFPMECIARAAPVCATNFATNGNLTLRDIYVAENMPLMTALASNITLTQTPTNQAATSGSPGYVGPGSSLMVIGVDWYQMDAGLRAENATVTVLASRLHMDGSWCLGRERAALLGLPPADGSSVNPPADPWAMIKQAAQDYSLPWPVPASIDHEVSRLIHDNLDVIYDSMHRQRFLPAVEGEPPLPEGVVVDVASNATVRMLLTEIGGAFTGVRAIDSTVLATGNEIGCLPWGIDASNSELLSIRNRFEEVAIPFRLHNVTDWIGAQIDNVTEQMQVLPLPAGPASNYTWSHEVQPVGGNGLFANVTFTGEAEEGYWEDYPLGTPNRLPPFDESQVTVRYGLDANGNPLIPQDRITLGLDGYWSEEGWHEENWTTNDNRTSTGPPAASICDDIQSSLPITGVVNGTFTLALPNFRAGVPIRAEPYLHLSTLLGSDVAAIPLPDNIGVVAGSAFDGRQETCGGPYGLLAVPTFPHASFFPGDPTNPDPPVEPSLDGPSGPQPMAAVSGYTTGTLSAAISGNPFPIYTLLDGAGNPRNVYGLTEVKGIVNVPLVAPDLSSIHYVIMAQAPMVGMAGLTNGITYGAGGNSNVPDAPDTVFAYFVWATEAVSSLGPDPAFGRVQPGTSNGGFGFQTDIPLHGTFRYYFLEQTFPATCVSCGASPIPAGLTSLLLLPQAGHHVLTDCITLIGTGQFIDVSLDRAPLDCGMSGTGTYAAQHTLEALGLQAQIGFSDRAPRHTELQGLIAPTTSEVRLEPLQNAASMTLAFHAESGGLPFTDLVAAMSGVDAAEHRFDMEGTLDTELTMFHRMAPCSDKGYNDCVPEPHADSMALTIGADFLGEFLLQLTAGPIHGPKTLTFHENGPGADFTLNSEQEEDITVMTSLAVENVGTVQVVADMIHDDEQVFLSEGYLQGEPTIVLQLEAVRGRLQNIHAEATTPLLTAVVDIIELEYLRAEAISGSEGELSVDARSPEDKRVYLAGVPLLSAVFTINEMEGYAIVEDVDEQKGLTATVKTGGVTDITLTSGADDEYKVLAGLSYSGLFGLTDLDATLPIVSMGGDTVVSVNINPATESFAMEVTGGLIKNYDLTMITPFSPEYQVTGTHLQSLGARRDENDLLKATAHVPSPAVIPGLPTTMTVTITADGDPFIDLTINNLIDEIGIAVGVESGVFDMEGILAQGPDVHVLATMKEISGGTIVVDAMLGSALSTPGIEFKATISQSSLVVEMTKGVIKDATVHFTLDQLKGTAEGKGLKLASISKQGTVADVRLELAADAQYLYGTPASIEVDLNDFIFVKLADTDSEHGLILEGSITTLLEDVQAGVNDGIPDIKLRLDDMTIERTVSDAPARVEAIMNKQRGELTVNIHNGFARSIDAKLDINNLPDVNINAGGYSKVVLDLDNLKAELLAAPDFPASESAWFDISAFFGLATFSGNGANHLIANLGARGALAEFTWNTDSGGAIVFQLIAPTGTHWYQAIGVHRLTFTKVSGSMTTPSGGTCTGEHYSINWTRYDVTGVHNAYLGKIPEPGTMTFPFGLLKVNTVDHAHDTGPNSPPDCYV